MPRVGAISWLVGLVVAGLVAEVRAAPQPDEPEPKTESEAKSGAEEAEPPKPLQRHRWVYDNLTAARYNPLGLLNQFRTGYRMQLINRDTTLFRDSFIKLLFHSFVNPAFGRVGPAIEVQPAAVLNLLAFYEYQGYFGSFDHLQSYQTPNADHSDTDFANAGDAGRNYKTGGHLFTAAALFQVKFGPVAMRDNLKFYYANMDLRPGDTVYYDQTLDILQPNDGWVVTNDVDLIYLFDWGLKLGSRYTLTHAFYRGRHNQVSSDNPNGPTHRLGPAILHTFVKRSSLRWRDPTLVFLAQWWVRHRWRSGPNDPQRDVHAAVPYLVLAFTFKGDFYP